MAAVSSCVASLRSPPSLPSSSATRHRFHRRRRPTLALHSSALFFPPAAASAISSRLHPPPAPSLPRRTRRLVSRSPRRAPVVVASAQFNVAKVLTTAWRVAKDGIEAGTNLVPDYVPRAIARICVAGVAVTVALFLLKSFVSTVLFVMAMMGLIYFTYMAFNAGEGPSPSGGGGTTTTDEETLEEARRIMEKYK